MGSALETLCGQAYGAKQYHMLGVHTQRAMLTLLAASLPLSLVWFFTADILTAFGQDRRISAEAGKFNRRMTPALFAYALLQCLNRFLQAQHAVVPMAVSSGVTAVFHVLACWVLVFKFELGSGGAAAANAVSNWVNVILLALHVKFSTAYVKTWTGFSRDDAFRDVLGFFKLSVSSAVMICVVVFSHGRDDFFGITRGGSPPPVMSKQPYGDLLHNQGYVETTLWLSFA
ncbi:hypothetical protein U1Q18_002213 [Sarracenia purpurea var. burkii]